MEDLLPIVDVSKLLLHQNDKSLLLSVGHEIKSALEEWGFFYISGHKLKISEMKEETLNFFEKSVDEKSKIEISGFRGYSGLGSEVTLGKKDWHECIDIMKEFEEDFKDKYWPMFSSKNQWPNGEKFKTVTNEYVKNAQNLGKLVLQALSQAYGSPSIFLEGFSDDPFWILRCLYYPVMDKSQENDSEIGLGVGPHSDYGCLTMIASDEEGLEIQRENKATGELVWMKVKLLKNHLIVNIGDMVSYLSHGIMKATRHQVRKVNKNRTSLAFFFEPHPRTKLQPLDFLEGHPLVNKEFMSGRPSSILYGDYLQNKYDSSFPTFVNKK